MAADRFDARHWKQRLPVPSVRAIVSTGGFVLLALVLFATTAWALDGPTPPQPSDPVGTHVAPHGGYSASSNMCLQCHDVHDASGDYALLWKNSVTFMCATCHGLHGLRGTLGLPSDCTECHDMHSGGSFFPTPRDPIGPGTLGTVSSRSAYNTSTPASTHGIGALAPPGETGIVMTRSDWQYSWGASGPPPADATNPSGSGTASDIGGGLYCGSCHTPHGDFGQVVNKWTAADEGRSIWWTNPTTGDQEQKLLHYDTGTGAWQVCDTGVTNCQFAQVRDAEDQLVYLYAYKLLSAYPNHAYSTLQSYGTEQNDDDGARWCGTCHSSRVDGAGYHNHPTGCSACHGNPTGGASTDFPHTSSTESLLIAYPDALCVTCHTSGSLP
ncbi:MAG: cytochrome c3 family protein [Actinobacteria bacterium]|nr:cytochrome c3 family protein [Actinomycetota bacterium]